ncbi:hypothetical protein C5Y96_19050 [Blastopirellula marina]|uniref:Uncharacterized protein n=1 Tax=Blastopirellula marina TaxID=124 RepID=A0A2S8F641_9BACT|nr:MULTISPECIES: hypothetical protein [Pirellulaceae]PQO27626.1 hypothetical protein C5Y96_19050 [Blastopirellula marina]RCS48164.1 hypothetical protein DTL36_19080 [Bremerella cremea]
MLASTVLLLSLFAADAEEGTDLTRPEGRVEQVVDVWRRRSEAFAAGEVEWEYSHNSFGRFESYWVPFNVEADSPLHATFQFFEGTTQYRSQSTDYPLLGNRFSKTNEREYYRSALLSQFSEKDTDALKQLDYSITLTSDGLRHSWKDSETEQSEYPRTIVLPQSAISSIDSLAGVSGFASDSHDHLSGVPSSVLHQLSTLPCLLTFRPFMFDSRLTEISKSVELTRGDNPFNSSLISLTLAADSSDENSLDWKLLCDPDLDFSVVRMLGSESSKTIVQCDVSYDKHASGYWIPLDWTVQIIGDDPSFIRQIARSSRTKLELSKAKTQEIDVATIPSTWINDFAANQHFLVMDDGSHWQIPDGKASWLSYEQIVAMSHGETPAGVTTDSGWPTKRQIIAALTQWPGLLFPLSILGGGMFMAIRLLAPKATDAQNVTATTEED